MVLEVRGRPSVPQTVGLTVVSGLLIAGVVLGAQWVLEWSNTQSVANDTVSARMMEKKSKHLQRVLEGMLEHDYQKVSRAAAEIERISESMEWFIADKAYDEDRAAFRTSLNALQAAVDENNSQAAILGAERLVDSCMRCHEHLFEDRAAR